MNLQLSPQSAISIDATPSIFGGITLQSSSFLVVMLDDRRQGSPSSLQLTGNSIEHGAIDWRHFSTIRSKGVAR